MQTRKLTGIILNIRPVGEFDRMIHVFSNELGVVRIIAKGVRRIKSRRSFHLDICRLTRMEIEECGHGSACVRYLREIATTDSLNELKKMPLRFSSACVIASFLKRILPELSPQKSLFSLTKKTFGLLNETNDPQKLLLTYFLKAMRLLGYLPNILPRQEMRSVLTKTLSAIDPQFVLNARRTLGIFATLESTRSN